MVAVSFFPLPRLGQEEVEMTQTPFYVAEVVELQKLCVQAGAPHSPVVGVVVAHQAVAQYMVMV